MIGTLERLLYLAIIKQKSDYIFLVKLEKSIELAKTPFKKWSLSAVDRFSEHNLKSFSKNVDF